MEFDVDRIVPGAGFSVDGASYIGAPRTKTAMFITKKVGHLLSSLNGVEKCLVFAEEGMDVPKELLKSHCFVFSANPQFAYATFANAFKEAKHEEEKRIKYVFRDGYYISESASVTEDAYIEPGVVIGHHVQIGERANLLAGSVIKNAVIGTDFTCNEHAVIGASGFTMATDSNGNKTRIPTLGNVIIGCHVEIGAHDNISCGSGGSTVIEDYVKLDTLVHVGHDVHLMRNVEITAGGIIGGFCQLGTGSYVGINAVLRNRLMIGDGAIIGMGATVIKDVPAHSTVAGNPAKIIN